MLDRFGDPEFGGFFFTDKSATDLIVRQKTASDSPLPSGNAVAAMVLLELGRVDEARRTLAAFAEQLDQHGEGMSSMVQAALLAVRGAGPFTVAAAPAGETGAAADKDADRPLSPQQIAEQVVTVGAEWAGPLELRVRLGILRGFHINAHDPGSDLPLIGTRLTAPDLDVAVDRLPARRGANPRLLRRPRPRLHRRGRHHRPLANPAARGTAGPRRRALPGLRRHRLPAAGDEDGGGADVITRAGARSGAPSTPRRPRPARRRWG